MSGNKIGFKLGLVILGAFVVVIVSLGLSIDRMFTNFYSAEMRTEVNELTTHFTAMSEPPDMLSEETMLKFADFSNVSVLYINEQGNVLANSGPYDMTNRTFIKPRDVELLFAGRTVESEYADPNGARYFIAAKPIFDAAGKNITAAVYVLSSTKHMGESLSAVRGVLVLAGVGALLLALAIAWIMARILSRPLVQMQVATRNIANGELETRLAIRRNDEIGMLADSINHLAVELQRYRDTRQEFLRTYPTSCGLRSPIWKDTRKSSKTGSTIRWRKGTGIWILSTKRRCDYSAWLMICLSWPKWKKEKSRCPWNGSIWRKLPIMRYAKCS